MDYSRSATQKRSQKEIIHKFNTTKKMTFSGSHLFVFTGYRKNLGARTNTPNVIPKFQLRAGKLMWFI